ncbi:ATP-binding protein [Oxynema sp. CENA135]|uniref:ATP-binding protein n=1 Tax=Oxynema sp. CENA135 TaxID=984206 RepID=UPI00190DB737|nr:anti-sigma regulatory factor [Oxynema sp. CENA135]MBK4728425.1 ATP-binding protein [Oxynema sp. CENA135]
MVSLIDKVAVELQVPDCQRITVKTDLTLLPDLLTWFERFNGPPLATPTWMQCQLVLAEGFTNAVRHAHKHLPPEVEIEIEVAVSSQCLELRIFDRGDPFDLPTAIERECQEIDPEAERGRGLYLMDRIGDRLEYRRTEDGGNCLYWIKYL